MDINAIIQNVLTFTIGTVSVSTVVIAVSKRIFDKWLESRLTKYNYELKIKLEEYKLEKQKIIEENKIRFTKLHEERAEIIRVLYKKLVIMQDHINVYVSDFKNGKYKSDEFNQHRANIFKSIPDFMRYTNRNRIFFDEDILFNIDEIEAIANIIINSYEGKHDDGSDFKNSTEWNALTMQMINDEIPKFRKELELKFRNLLGVQ